MKPGETQSSDSSQGESRFTARPPTEHVRRIHERYLELQAYVGWNADDATRVASVAGLAETFFNEIVSDFYDELERHPEARRVIRDADQVDRLKATWTTWLRELFSGRYDSEYVAGRWRVGWRHVEIGLDQVFTNVALSRLRRGLLRGISERWRGDSDKLLRIRESINTLLDLDLAIIEDAYQTEHLQRQALSERLATIGQVAGGIAHELRNPLSTLRTSAYFLRNVRTASPEKVGEHLERIERQVAIADRVITALTEFARQPLPTLVPTPLGDCVEECLASNQASPSIRVETDFIDELPEILADREQLAIVMANLVRNAYDAMPGGGVLKFAGRDTPHAVVLSVTDTGVGIPRENIARVMDPLFSTKTRGIGLGLSLTRAILDKHGATIDIQSEPGKGTIVLVAFQRAQ